MTLTTSTAVESPWFGWSRRARRTLNRYWLRWRFELFLRGHLDRVVVEHVAGRPFVVLPTVFNPRLFRSGAYFAETLGPLLVPVGSSVLDLGTGSGVLAVVVATWSDRVVAVDLNPEAVRCARINALLHRRDDRIDVRYGDLFQPIGDERFDVILFNPPYYRGSPASELDRAWRSSDVVERFAGEVSDHLLPGGRALVVLSTDGEASSFLASFGRAGLSVAVVAERRHPNETFSIYALRASP
jgi:HemK-related putative methylase